MQISKHETDILLLPETKQETNQLKEFVKKCGYKSHSWQLSNVKGQSWYGKLFLEIPFGIDLLEKVKKIFKVTSCRA